MSPHRSLCLLGAVACVALGAVTCATGLQLLTTASDAAMQDGLQGWRLLVGAALTLGAVPQWAGVRACLRSAGEAR